MKLVISDIDNTLVPKHDTLSVRAKKCIEFLQNNGIYFGLASGRSIEEIKRIIKRWGLLRVDCIVYLNGCGLLDNVKNENHEYYKMKREWIKETLEVMKKFSANPVMYYEDRLLTRYVDSIVQLSAKTAGMQIRVAESDEEFYKVDNAKIMYRVKAYQMPIIEKYLTENPSDYYIGYKTQDTLIEFSDRRVSKAVALRSFCNANKISLKDVMAFGDTTNDNNMLKISGLGVCMLNGSDDTKQIADVVTTKSCNEDGWADFVESYFLKHEGEKNDKII